MNKKLIVSAFFSFLAGACAHIPPEVAADLPLQAPRVAPPVASAGTTCMNCASEPRVAYAVSTPGPCNDYPVTYRVQVPTERDKVLPVDQIVLRSSTGSVVAQANTACYIPR